MINLLDKICNIFAVMAALLLLFVTFSIGYSIFTRQTGLDNPIWIVQFNEYSLLWVTFLGTAWLLATDKHVAIHLLTSALGEKTNRILDILHNLVGFGLCGFLLWYSFFTTKDHLVRGVIDTQAVDIPKGLVLIVIPLGFTLLCLQFLKKLYISLFGAKATTNL